MNEIKNADNPRYTLVDGQWWYRPFSRKPGTSWPRIRAEERICERCGARFLGHARTRHSSTRSTGFFCGIQCANASVKASMRGTKRGPDHSKWQGGRRITPQGYIQVWSGFHPARNKNNYVYEHRLVMEEILGRPLERFEEVHHKNGVRDDNRPENLELWVKSQPGGQRARDLIEYAKWVLERYEPLALQGKLI